MKPSREVCYQYIFVQQELRESLIGEGIKANIQSKVNKLWHQKDKNEFFFIELSEE